MRYPDEVIEEVRSRSDIVDVISQYVRLQKKGSSHFGLCPFHNEKTPSFSVSGPKQMFYCFGCGAGGNVFTFLMKYDNLTFQEAVKVMADRTGVTLPEPEETPEAQKKRTVRETLLAINKEAAVYFYRALREKPGETGLKYLRGRGLSDETLHRFGLGYADINHDTLLRHLKGKGFSDDMIIAAGLATHDEKRGTRDKFWNRVMFPIQDVNGKVIGFGGRVTGDGKPKYLNSPETEVFDKSRNLYGLNLAKSSRRGYLILCEGYLDVIAIHEVFAPVAVASLGTAFTTGQASLLRRYTEEVILAYDSDTAGTNAATRAIGILKEAGIRGRVLKLAPYKDPDEFIRAEGAEAFEQRIHEATNTFFFEIETMEKGFNMTDPAEQTAFYRAVAGKLCEFETAVERDNYLNAFSSMYGVPADNMKSLVKEIAAGGGIVRKREPLSLKARPDGKKPDADLQPQRLLLAWLTEEPVLYKTVSQYITEADFTDPLVKEIATKLFQALGEGTQVSAAGLLDAYEDEEQQAQAAAVFHAAMPELKTADEREKALRDVVYEVKRISVESGTKDSYDVETVQRTIADKRALERLRKLPKLEII